ncbi:MAG TPA: glucose 1-dehydrogenase [Alphaproteobacteria bacterium]|nr:glucose 1-dehydrogenase [Alphaproteobacteria bacterium]
MRLKNKVAVITGGANGIGRATAMVFAQEGAKVAIADVMDGSPVVDAIHQAGGEAFYRRTDVAKSADVEQVIDAAVNRWGGLDIIFNNAGIAMAKPITEVSEEEFDRLFAINVKGVYLGCRLALPHMLSRGKGSIINMSSSGGLLARASDPAYSASKHAVMGLTKALAVSYAHMNIRVNAICPGPIETSMLWGTARTPEERRARLPAILATCPAARSATAEDVANAALYLASDESAFVNGVGLAIDGGKAAGVMPLDRYRLDFEIHT